MATVVERMIRAAKLDPQLYREVEQDEGAMKQALGSVLISSAAAGIGGAGVTGPLGLIWGGLAALLGWFVWSFVVHFVGTRLLPEPRTRTDLAPLLRATGFAAAPGVIRVVGVVPLLGPLANIIGSLWMLAAFVVAVRQVMGYTSTGRAVAVCVVGWFLYWVVTGVFLMIGLGGVLLI
ncbi:hypothetical protein DRQ50_11235 [bacterium]|nr:MAG: hypothetical protein DRQ50_11235 [bacterium]